MNAFQILATVALIATPAIADAACSQKSFAGTWAIADTGLPLRCKALVVDSAGRISTSKSQCYDAEDDYDNYRISSLSGTIKVASSCKMSGVMTFWDGDVRISFTGRLSSDGNAFTGVRSPLLKPIIGIRQ